jgi:hypothetical protein
MDTQNQNLVTIVIAAFGAGGAVSSFFAWLMNRDKNSVASKKLNIDGDVAAGHLALEVAQTYKKMNSTLLQRQDELEHELAAAHRSLADAQRTSETIKSEMSNMKIVQDRMIVALRAISPNHPLLVELGEASVQM